jgi:actin cytoskeleton-regulatory complex protein PAN1
LVRRRLQFLDLLLISARTLSDTTKSGQLLFPEFALAMYLCNLKLKGQGIPASLPDHVKNEVSSMVDIISFGVPDDAPAAPAPTNVPNFNQPLRQNTASPPTIQQPQPQANNTQLLSTLTTQPTGMMPQITGYPGPGGFGGQQTGMQPQLNFPSNPQPTGYSGPRPPMPPMPTGFGNNLAPTPTGIGGIAPLNAQPTGMPGQWGLVNTPATGLPNIEALKQQMMPQPGRESGFSTTGLTGNATIPWAVTKDEKKIYDELFKSWDGFGKGYVTGQQAIEVFSQSGLAKSDLEAIWTLSDPNNKGRLNLDEFAVAMHLIYRKLNGYPIPSRLPPELTPPSQRNIDASLKTVKSLLSRDADEWKSSGGYLQPQRTGVSYMKQHSFRAGSPNYAGKPDATRYQHNDNSIGFRSTARHRIGAGGRSPSPAQPSSPDPEKEELTPDQLRKLIKEKQVLLDAIDFRDEGQAEEDEALDRRDKRDADDLYRRIRRIQEDIDRNPNASAITGDSDAERRALRRQLQGLNDRLPTLASQVRRCERAIADAQLELFRIRDAKAHPNSVANIVGTGPGGTVTEADRRKARARAMMQQRSAALTGKPIASSDDDPEAATRRLEAESQKINTERESNERMIKDIEESVNVFGKDLEDSLKGESNDSTTEHERRRWEDGLGVEDEVRDFIFELQRESKSAKARQTDSRRDAYASSAPRTEPPRIETPPSRSTDATPQPSAPAASSGPSYSSYRTAEERAAYIKQQAEQRMQERLAALGLRVPGRSGPAETPDQRAEREKKELEEKRRKADEEDARRDAERQRKLEGESIAPPTVAKPAAKRPPPPPIRKGQREIAQHDAKRAEAEAKRAEHDLAEKALREQQETQEAERKRLEYDGILVFAIAQIANHRAENRSARQRLISPKSKKPRRLAFVSLKSRSNEASSRSRKRRSADSRPRRRKKKRKLVLPLSALKSKQLGNASDSSSFSSRASTMRNPPLTKKDRKRSRPKRQRRQQAKSFLPLLLLQPHRRCHRPSLPLDNLPHLLLQPRLSSAVRHDQP